MINRRNGDKISIPGDYQYLVLEEGFAPQRFWHFVKYSEAARWLDPKPDDMILDVGCGSGVFAAQLADRVSNQVIGIDSNEVAIVFARKQFRKPNLRYDLGFVDDLNFPENSINKISFLEVIEHIYPEQAANTLCEFYRILHTGGRLVISTPNSNSLWPLIELMMDNMKIVPKMSEDQHVVSYNANSLIALGELSGFRLVTCRTINGIAPWLALISWKFALFIHKLEQLSPHRFGNILLVCFEKKLKRTIKHNTTSIFGGTVYSQTILFTC